MSRSTALSYVKTGVMSYVSHIEYSGPYHLRETRLTSRSTALLSYTYTCVGHDSCQESTATPPMNFQHDPSLACFYTFVCEIAHLYARELTQSCCGWSCSRLVKCVSFHSHMCFTVMCHSHVCVCVCVCVCVSHVVGGVAVDC